MDDKLYAFLYNAYIALSSLRKYCESRGYPVPRQVIESMLYLNGSMAEVRRDG